MSKLKLREPTEQELNDLNNNFKYHAPTIEQVAQYDRIRYEAKQFAHTLLQECPPSRERSLAITHLEMVVMCANASIARHSAVDSINSDGSDTESNSKEKYETEMDCQS